MRETRTEAEVLESLGCAETPDQALAFMGLDRTDFAALAPIRRLQLAMIHEAMKDALMQWSSETKAFGRPSREATLAWIAAPYESGTDLADISTFEGCCLGLGLCPDYLRALIASAPGAKAAAARRRMNRTSGSMTRVGRVRSRAA